jgi:hypothetical protein
MKKLVAMIMVVVCLGLAVSAQATPSMSVWHSYDATIRTASESDGLIRGDIVDASNGINAELKFYMSGDVLGVAEAASVATGGNGLYSTIAPDACTDSAYGDGLELIMDFSNYWRLPGGNGTFATDLSVNEWFVPFVGKQLTARPVDGGDHGDLPGGVPGVYDLSFHPPSTWSEGDANVYPDEFKFENHLGVIAFIAPQDGKYEISNFGARAMQDIGAVDLDRPDDLDSIIAGGLIEEGGDRDITWKLSGNTINIDLLEGDEIHFAVHSTALFEPIAANQEFYHDATNVAFDITLVPEPATIGMLGLGALLLRRRKYS